MDFNFLIVLSVIYSFPILTENWSLDARETEGETVEKERKKAFIEGTGGVLKGPKHSLKETKKNAGSYLELTGVQLKGRWNDILTADWGSMSPAPNAGGTTLRFGRRTLMGGTVQRHADSHM